MAFKLKWFHQISLRLLFITWPISSGWYNSTNLLWIVQLIARILVALVLRWHWLFTVGFLLLIHGYPLHINWLRRIDENCWWCGYLVDWSVIMWWMRGLVQHLLKILVVTNITRETLMSLSLAHCLLWGCVIALNDSWNKLRIMHILVFICAACLFRPLVWRGVTGTDILNALLHLFQMGCTPLEFNR